MRRGTVPTLIIPANNLSQLAEKLLGVLGLMGKPGNWVTLISGKLSAESSLTGSLSRSPIQPSMPPRSSMSLRSAGPVAGLFIQSPSCDQTVRGTSTNAGERDDDLQSNVSG